MNFKLLATGVIGATLSLTGCVTSETSGSSESWFF